jgi:hypothetical protein
MLNAVCCDPQLAITTRKTILDAIVAQKIVKFIANDLVDEGSLQQNTFQQRLSSFKVNQL